MENLLTSLAFFDTKHDFDDYAEMFRFEIADSLPGKIFDFPNEEYVLDIASKYAETIKLLEGNTPNELFTALGGTAMTPVAIVCDASFCSSLINLLKRNIIGHVYYVLNREVLNDPAPTAVPKEEGSLLVARDIDRKSVKYFEYMPDDYLDTPSLHSDLKFVMDFIDGKVVTKTFMDNTKIETTEGSEPNEIGNVLYEIFDKNNTLVTQSAFTRKRAGDWLQALSCMDTERLYSINEVPKNLKGSKLYFCSSDRVAISFALYSDINCILKRDNLYFVYHSKHLSSMSHPIREERFKQLCKDAGTLVPVLTDCVSTLEELMKTWATLLLDIKDVKSFEQIKRLTTVAFHYQSLVGRYSEDDLEEIKLFIANPYDSYFYDYRRRDSVTDTIRYISKNVRIYKHLNVYDTTVEEEYYGLFDFSNTDPEKFDMVCGSSLMTLLMHSCLPELVTFALIAMEKIIELSDHNIELTTLYTLVIETNKKYLKYAPDYVQKGGALNVTRASMQWIGDYLASWQIPGKGGVGTIHLSEQDNLTTSFRVNNDIILEYLMLEKGIIPKNYKEYLENMAAFYPHGEWPRQHLLDFFKISSMKHRKTYRRKNRKIGTLKRMRKMR